MLIIKQFHNLYSSSSQVSNRFQQFILVLLLLGSAMGVQAQNLTIADNGETGTSGTNWTTTGTNPITISITGSVTVASSVVLGYLNAGLNVNLVVASGVSGSGHLVFTNDFTYTGSGARTLTLTADQDILMNGDITATNSALSLNFIAGNRILLDAGIFTNGGAVTFNDGANVHFQQTSGIQNLDTQGGNLDFNDTNVFLLRHDGSLAIETAGGELRLGTGEVAQTDTSYQIRTLLNGLGGQHVNGNETYGISLVAGREYSMRLYFWDSWDDPEEGRLGIRQTNGPDVQYFRATRTNGNTFTSTNASNGTQFRTGNLGHLGRNSSYQDQYVDVAFVALTSGQLLTFNNLNGTIDDESLELANVYETQPTSTFTSGSRSLSLSTTTGRILGSSKNITGLDTLTMSTNNDDGFMDGIISGTTNFVLNGTGRVRLSGQNSYTGTTTVNTGTLRLVPEYTNRNFITGAFINNGAVTYEGGNVDRETLFLDGAISGSGTWNVSNDVATLQFDHNRLSLRGTTTTSGQITVGQFGNLWTEGANVNSTSNIALNDVTSRLRFFAPDDATIAVGALTGTGTVDFANGNGGTALTLSTNTGAANVQFDGFITNSGTLAGPTSLSLIKQGTGTFTLTQNNTYSGSTTINAGTLVLQNNAPDPTNKTFDGTGGLRIESIGTAFTSAFTTSGWSFGTALSNLTIGKTTNTQNVTVATGTSIAGSIAAYGGSIAVNENLNTTAGGANGDVLLKGTENLSVAANKTITTNGGDVIFWSDSDNDNSGSILLADNNTINTTNGNTTSNLSGGGTIILAGGADDGSNDGTANDGIPDGFAISSTEAGIRLKNNLSLNSGGGDIAIRGKSLNTTSGWNAVGLRQEGILSMNSGTGSISLIGESSRAYGIELQAGFGTWTDPNNGTILIQSGATNGTAISLKGNGYGSYGVLFNYGRAKTIAATGGGNIRIEGATTSDNYVGEYSSDPTLWDIFFGDNTSILSSGGTILVDGSAEGIRTRTRIALGEKTSSLVENSSSNIVLAADRFQIDGTPGTTISTTGAVTIAPANHSFLSAIMLPISNLSFSSGITGLTIGKPTNTANITFGAATTIAGPVAAYGGTITLNANLTTTNNGDISLFTDNALGGLTAARALTAAGAFKMIPQSTSFAADVTYPVTNLTATSTGLTIGKTTNTRNITVNQDVTGGAGIELYGGNLAINAHLETTGSGDMLLKGTTTVAAGKNIESAGNFTQDGDITFKSAATATASFGTLGGTYTTTSGSVTTERYIPARRAFRFLSPSVTTTTSINTNWQENTGTASNLGTHITGAGGTSNGFDATSTSNPSLFTFTAGAWQAVTNTNSNTLTAGTGYRIMVRGDRTISLATNTPTPTTTVLRATGTLKTGNQSAVLNNTADGFSFVGNPYQAPVNMKDVINTSSNMSTGFLYYWDPILNTRGGYVTRDLTADENSVTSNFNEFVQPGQAVFVQKDNTATAAALTFTEANKSVANASAGVFRTSTSTTHSALRLKLMATLDNNLTEVDGALLLFNNSYSSNLDVNDAIKLANLDEQVALIIDQQQVAIASQSIPNDDEALSLHLANFRQTDYQWHFELNNYVGPTPFLRDSILGTMTEITTATSIPFTVDNLSSISYEDRFEIVFQNTTLSNTDPSLENTILAYPNPAKSGEDLFLNHTSTKAVVTIHNLLGQEINVLTQSYGNALRVKTLRTLSTGIYVVSINDNDIKTVIKWIIE